MKITVMTVYRDKSCETYVAAIRGSITREQAKEIARCLDLVNAEDEEQDMVGFQEVELAEDWTQVQNAVNAFPDDWTLYGE